MGYGINRLTPEEEAFFKANWYLVKENVHVDPALVKRARELWWSKCPSTHVRQDGEHTPPGMKSMPGEEYRKEIEKIVKDTVPAECHALAGSMIFWDHNMVHTASRNTGSGIRSGVIYEFYKNPNPARAYPEDALERTWAEEARGNEPGMWGDWSEEVQACPPPRADSADHARL
jgi:hypothetical protein